MKRTTLLALADATTEAVDIATMLIGGALGAWAGYTYYPETWSGDWRLAATGAIAVIAAVAINDLADLILSPVRRLLIQARRGRPHSQAPATLDEGLAQVAAATENDAASRAASASWRIDQGDQLLRDEDRWRGYEDGEASFFLAPGVWLHYRSQQNKYGNTKPCFTLLTGEGDQPVPITGMEQIRHQLAARAAGLPAAPSAADTEDHDQDDLLDDDLTGLHATA
ncbi:hypothetical protein M8I34_32375 [Streptomyces sp. MCA2]|uniref:hypothetical protein n=1 Tax=Streptomyces sp. MCA2 TaxID=2944805 RepID=UPI0020203BBD|nr:hypothetical protein [Streptomyces sp. MCA2]MCL7496066.1 hypothetical protein [Streptomyces sp. MCA2]